VREILCQYAQTLRTCQFDWPSARDAGFSYSFLSLPSLLAWHLLSQKQGAPAHQGAAAAQDSRPNRRAKQIDKQADASADAGPAGGEEGFDADAFRAQARDQKSR
jgi:hypothetical protein